MLGGAGTLIVQTKLRATEQNYTGDNLTLALISNSSYSEIIVSFLVNMICSMISVQY